MNRRPSTVAIPTPQNRLRPNLALVWVAATALSIVASSVASASTATTDPTGSTAAHTDAEHATDTTEVTLAVDGSAEPTSPEAEAFCAAELAAEAAVTFEDEAAIGAAVEALTAAAEPVGLTDTVGVLLATVEEGGPEFDEAYTAVIDYMKANCGYAELDVVASEYHFDGLPSELPAGPTIITLDNVGEQVHEIYIGRVNDDVTLTVEELAELPEDQLHGPMVTPTAFAFTFPGATRLRRRRPHTRPLHRHVLPSRRRHPRGADRTRPGRSRRTRGLASRRHRGRTTALHHRNDPRVQRRLTHAPCHQESSGMPVGLSDPRCNWSGLTR